MSYQVNDEKRNEVGKVELVTDIDSDEDNDQVFDRGKGYYHSNDEEEKEHQVMYKVLRISKANSDNMITMAKANSINEVTNVLMQNDCFVKYSKTRYNSFQIFIGTEIYKEGSLDDNIKKRHEERKKAIEKYKKASEENKEANFLNNEGCLSEPEVINFARQMLAAITYAHNNGVYLRAFTPDHIFLDGTTAEGETKYRFGGLEYAQFAKKNLLTYSSTWSKRFTKSFSKVHYFNHYDAYLFGEILLYLATGVKPNKKGIIDIKWKRLVETYTLKGVIDVLLKACKKCDFNKDVKKMLEGVLTMGKIYTEPSEDFVKSSGCEIH